MVKSQRSPSTEYDAFEPFLRSIQNPPRIGLTPIRFVRHVMAPTMRRVAALYLRPDLLARCDERSKALDDLTAVAMLVPTPSTPLRYRLDHMFHPDTEVRDTDDGRAVEFRWTLDFLLLAYAGLHPPFGSSCMPWARLAVLARRYFVQYLGHMRYHQEAQRVNASLAHEINGEPRLVSDFAADFAGRLFLLTAYQVPVAADVGEYDPAVATLLEGVACCDVWKMRQSLRGPLDPSEQDDRFRRSLAGRIAERLVVYRMAAPVEVYFQKGMMHSREAVARVNDVPIRLGQVPSSDKLTWDVRRRLLAEFASVAAVEYGQVLTSRSSLRGLARARVDALVSLWSRS